MKILIQVPGSQSVWHSHSRMSKQEQARAAVWLEGEPEEHLESKIVLQFYFHFILKVN